MKSAWEVKRLGEILRLEYGKPLPETKRKSDGLYPVYGANGVIAKSDDFYCEKETIIVGRKGSAGQLTLTESKFWPLDVTFYVTFDKELYDLLFLYHLLNFIDVTKLAKGVKPGINRNEVYDISVSIPPLKEQKRIVAVLDKASSAIEKAKENAERNLQNAKELFESYLNSVFANPGADWVVKYFDEISENLDSKRKPVTQNLRVSGEFPYYGASGRVDFVDNYIFDGDFLLVSEDGANLLARTYPIAFSISGKSWVNNHVHVLKFENIYGQRFVEYYLNSIPLDDYISGMAQPKLNQRMLNTIPIPFPPLSTQIEIIDKLDALSLEVKKIGILYNQKLTNLEEFKKSILQKAFNGELITTSEIEI